MRTYADQMRRKQQECREAGHQTWIEPVQRIGLSDAEMLWQSTAGVASRTYRQGSLVHKIRLHGVLTTPTTAYGDLQKEFSIVKRCRGICNIPRAVDYRREGNVEIAVYEWVSGSPLYECRLGFMPAIYVVFKVAWIMVRLSWRGIAHNDLTLNNVLLDNRAQVYLIDFD